jgi:hypothetical protein
MTNYDSNILFYDIIPEKPEGPEEEEEQTFTYVHIQCKHNKHISQNIAVKQA